MGNIIKQNKLLQPEWQELSLRKPLPRPPPRSLAPATNVSSHAVASYVSVAPRTARVLASVVTVDPDPALPASSPAAPRNATAAPRAARLSVPSAVGPDLARAARCPAAP